MEYDRNETFSNMYLGTEIRFDGIARLVRNLATLFDRRVLGHTAAIA